jgi:hypothetical protein
MALLTLSVGAVAAQQRCEALKRAPGDGFALVDRAVSERFGEMALAGPRRSADAEVLRASDPFQRSERLLRRRRDR